MNHSIHEFAFLLWLLICAAWLSALGCGRGAAYNDQGLVTLDPSLDVSPDGKSLVFAGAGYGGGDLYLLDLASRRVTALTSSPEREAHPAFSPDGRSVVYGCARRPDAPRHLFLRSLDGAHVRQITDGAATKDEYPSFSRDGRRIVFARLRNYRVQPAGAEIWDGGGDVYMVNRDGSDLRRLTHLDSQGMIRPKFSPNGRSVVFEQTVQMPGYDLQMRLARVDVSGRGSIRQIGKFGWNASNLAFCPDGRHLVFVSDMEMRYAYHLHRMTLGGTRPIVVGMSNDADQITHPVVAPDGRTIYYLNGYGAGLWQTNMETNATRQIATGALFSDPLHWKP